MAVFQMPSPPTVNDTIVVPPVEPAYHTLRWPGVYRPEQHDVQHAGPDVSTSNPFVTSSLPVKRTATMAALVGNSDDEDDDEDDDDYADDSGFFEISEDDSDSTMNDDTPGSDTDSDEEPGDEGKTSAIPPDTNQHHDLASITRQLKSAKTHLTEVKDMMSKAEEGLNLLDDDMEAVHDSSATRDISPALAQAYSKIKMRALDNRKQASKCIYGDDLNRDFQEALDNAAATFAEEWVNIIKRHNESRDRDRRVNYINWERTLKQLEIKDYQTTIDSIEKQVEGLRQKAKAIKIIDRVHELGVEGIKTLIETGNESLEWSFGISDVEEDEECTCCD
ncbi:unnamed protein product [Fusarium equiseti]|uniref:Uncharacterized protein n=1 Tax=Fusarium equiseti TaxID=61235 RepID=A0A8J2NLL8_FUSEQ|nr:unnamed protein product [Fusarium equiseti]